MFDHGENIWAIYELITYFLINSNLNLNWANSKLSLKILLMVHNSNSGVFFDNICWLTFIFLEYILRIFIYNASSSWNSGKWQLVAFWPCQCRFLVICGGKALLSANIWTKIILIYRGWKFKSTLWVPNSPHFV